MSLTDKKEYFNKLVQRYKIYYDERTIKEIKIEILKIFINLSSKI